MDLAFLGHKPLKPCRPQKSQIPRLKSIFDNRAYQTKTTVFFKLSTLLSWIFQKMEKAN